MIKTRKRIISLILFLIIIFANFIGCGSSESKTFETLEDFQHAKIGILTGSSQELIVKQRFPKAERVYFSRPADLVLAVEQDKIDAYMLGSPFLAATIWENAKVKRFDQAISQGDIAFAFPKDNSSEAIRQQLNQFIDSAKEDGTIARLESKWLGKKEPTVHPDYSNLSGENGTIRLAVSSDNKPMMYKYKKQFTGYEMELLTLFATQYGYKFQIEAVPLDSIIMGMTTGKYDMAASSLQVTEERAESIDFSQPYMQFDVVLVVKDNDAKQEKTLSDLENSTIGIITGTSWDLVAKERFPNAERKYFSSVADAAIAVKQGKIDTFFADQTVYAGMRWENESITFINEPLSSISNALIFKKEGYNQTLYDQINQFVLQSRNDGTLDELSKKWFGNSEPTVHPNYTGLTGENGTIKIAIGDSMRPTAYKKGTQYTGYEVDFLTMFATQYGYKLDLQGMAFDAIIPSVSSGKCDIGACGITITEERSENVTFAQSHFETYGVAVIRNEDANSGQTIHSFEDLNDGKLAILTGSIWDGVASEKFPSCEKKYFTVISDMFLSLEKGKVDAILGDRTFYVSARWENLPVAVLDETAGYISCGFMLSKTGVDEQLLSNLNQFIAQSKTDGTIETLENKWLGDSEPNEHPDYQSLSGENGTIKVAVDDTAKPMTYKKNDYFTGFDIDLLTLFAREYGYKLEIEGMSFSALIPAVSTERFDISACGTAITPERQESVTFTDCYLEVDGVIIVSTKGAQALEKGFFEKIAESFEKTFIREDRWKLIVEGVGVTMLISLCAAFIGTLIGFGLYMLSRADAKWLQTVAKGVAKVYSRIVAGTPVVVILMILFYVVFGKVRDMSGIIVAIIGFSLTFGAFVFDHMTVSVGSVDKGQTEAAYALGYPKNKAFFRVIFPQAMKIFLPSYCGHAVELIKATAVVGYIAVNDLTKMGDIIRSNTYEAFFPLIATAIIYFFLTWLLSTLLGFVKKRFEPKNRTQKDILKGVKKI